MIDKMTALEKLIEKLKKSGKITTKIYNLLMKEIENIPKTCIRPVTSRNGQFCGTKVTEESDYCSKCEIYRKRWEEEFKQKFPDAELRRKQYSRKEDDDDDEPVKKQTNRGQVPDEDVPPKSQSNWRYDSDEDVYPKRYTKKPLPDSDDDIPFRPRREPFNYTDNESIKIPINCHITISFMTNKGYIGYDCEVTTSILNFCGECKCLLNCNLWYTCCHCGNFNVCDKCVCKTGYQHCILKKHRLSKVIKQNLRGNIQKLDKRKQYMDILGLKENFTQEERKQ